MVQSVELLLDAAAESAVRAQWRALAAAGLPSQAAHTGASNRPHVTAAVAAELAPEAEAALCELEFEPFPITLGSPVVFGRGRFVLVRLVIPTRALLALHRRIHVAVGGAPDIPENSEPDAWTPHVTLARRLPPERLGAAIELIAADGDSPATVAGIRRWDGDRRREWTVRGT
ncbi:2'-5' RNA ligase family protein [Nocardia asteroides]|uniref:2'-5' RNA ligase family protein n=1 Tax=Nocardia asteroides TaxID=1824 RepID=UPI001E557031|nr:2'-5' RNA ligase family protein [Nocardia asteroides]UGT60816.1 2'-5' RNA ligase family protein [Nocardia asteroides]